MLVDLADAVAEDRWVCADLVGLSASAAEEGKDHGFEESSGRAVRNIRAEEVRKAYLESRDPGEKHLVADHSRDRIEDSSSGIVVVVDVESSARKGMEADYGFEGLVVKVG